jgi:hypothetical protein
VPVEVVQPEVAPGPEKHAPTWACTYESDMDPNEFVRWTAVAMAPGPGVLGIFLKNPDATAKIQHGMIVVDQQNFLHLYNYLKDGIIHFFKVDPSRPGEYHFIEDHVTAEVYGSVAKMYQGAFGIEVQKRTECRVGEQSHGKG